MRLKVAKKLNRTAKVVFVIVVVLLAIRAALPEVIKYGINKYLANNIEGYTGSIEDFDLALYRGAYQIKGFKISKENRTAVPLVQIEEADASIAWKELFNGSLVASVTIDQPRVNFIDSKNPARKQTGKGLSPKKIFDKLLPISINTLKIKNGVVRILNYDLKVPAEVAIDGLYATATNIKSKATEELLPSDISIEGKLQSDAPFTLKGKFSSLSAKPAFDIDFQMKDFNLKNLNEILLAYGPLSFTKGEVSVYGEIAAKDGRFIGYVKPFLEKVDVVRKQERFYNFKHLGLELVSAGGNLLFRNGKNDTAATKIEFKGPQKDPKVKTKKAVSYTIDNAFGTPFKEGIEHSIDITRL